MYIHMWENSKSLISHLEMNADTSLQLPPPWKNTGSWETWPERVTTEPSEKKGKHASFKWSIETSWRSLTSTREYLAWQAKCGRDRARAAWGGHAGCCPEWRQMVHGPSQAWRMEDRKSGGRWPKEEVVGMTGEKKTPQEQWGMADNKLRRWRIKVQLDGAVKS